MPKTARKPADYILPLYMNGLNGRMLRMPPPKGTTKETLFIYGHHASLERYWGVAEFINRYSGMTIPDLPGFGGMDPFYKIGEKPTLDNMADYLASFIKLRYRNKRFNIAGFSLGVIIITRMLQKHPELVKNVENVVSIAGFTHKDDFKFKRRNFLLMRYGTSILSNRLPAAFCKYIAFTSPFIRLGYRIGEAISFNAKVALITEKDRKERIDFEIHLWKCNDMRTYMDMAVTMFKLDLSGTHINKPIYHASVENDHYFNNLHVEHHMRQIYKNFHHAKINPPAHSPPVIASAKDAAPFIPLSFRKLFGGKR